MKHKKHSSIKNQIFFSNVRIMIITVAVLMIVPAIIHYFMIAFGGIENITSELSELEEWRKRRPPKPSLDMRFIGLGIMVLTLIIICACNNFLTFRLTRKIIRHLEPLSEGVRQIQEHNFSYRIDYRDEDEFRSICDAFNEMAARLEESSMRRSKDEASRRELVAGISHDLRTPLTSIKGYLEGLESGVADTPQMREKYFNTIKKKTADMEYILSQLFLFSKLDMNEFPFTMRRIQLDSAINDMIEEVSGEYEERGLIIKNNFAVKNDTDSSSIYVDVDSLYLRSVIINILENSVRYKIKERALLDITLLCVNNTALLRFADDGPGVPAESLSKLFDVFYRADPSRANPAGKKGSGLGLAISKKIIEGMNGHIRAELPPQGGLALLIELPVLEGT